MKIADIGGEFALIQRLTDRMPNSHADLQTGIGDDAAVIGRLHGDQERLLVTTDMLVEDTHFRCDWTTPEQIGIKSVACNVSDIAAMGGRPTFLFVSLALSPHTSVAWAESLYQGMGTACRRYGVVLAGGDTTHGKTLTISITLLGQVTSANLCLRSHARPGDYLCVTGHLGGAAAGLALLRAGINPPPLLRDKHLASECRLDVSALIAQLAHAMIDISDGLAAEVNHICEQSGTGAEIMAARIPVHPLVRDAARRTGSQPLALALTGGEDFELLFSITPEKKKQLDAEGIKTTRVGNVLDAASGRFLVHPDGSREPLTGGYNHFSTNAS